MTPLFSATEYRSFLRQWLESQGQTRGIMTKMAQSLGCQNSHLTRLLREEVHLTFDQAYALTVFMKLTEIETRYFLKLVEFERAGSPPFRHRLKTELDEMRRDQENLATRFKKDELGHLEKEMTYYSNWYWSAIHVLTDIPQYQTAKAIADRLKLPEVFVKNCLQKLEAFSLVEQRKDGSWKYASSSLHLPKTSPMNSIQHANWRSRAVSESQNPDSKGIHYTTVQSVSRADFDKIKHILLSSMDAYKSVADASAPEELVCFACDFFVVE